MNILAQHSTGLFVCAVTRLSALGTETCLECMSFIRDRPCIQAIVQFKFSGNLTLMNATARNMFKAVLTAELLEQARTRVCSCRILV